MKKVFTGREVPHIWAQQQQSEGRGGGNANIFFEGATIYSYGKHFPIATIEGDDVLFTLRGYSNTTAKHIGRAGSAVSHKNIIYCYEVPVKFWGNDLPLKKQAYNSTHEKNMNEWKREIKALFEELENKRIRNIQDRLNSIDTHINRLNRYCQYFNIKIKDKELKKLLKVAASPDFLRVAKEAREKQIAANEKKMQQAEKAYLTYLGYWRDNNNAALLHLPNDVKKLANYYQSQSDSFTRLRFNREQNSVETSKGVQIPAPVAKRAYIALNGCLEGKCDSLKIPVLSYIITRTTDKAIVAGCHTIPKEDVKYIANLLNW